MRVALIFFLALASQLGYSQDLTGIWRGSFVSSDRMESLFSSNDRYKLEVQIDQHGKAFESVTYSYKTTMFYGKATSNGTVNPKTGKVYLQEIKIVEVKMSYGSSACIMNYFLQYTKNGDEEFLEGNWKGYSEKDSSFCNKGTVMLRKVTTSDFYKEPFLVKRELELKNKRKPKNPLAKATPKTLATKPSTKTTPPVTDSAAIAKKTTPPSKLPVKDSAAAAKKLITKTSPPVKKVAPSTGSAPKKAVPLTPEKPVSPVPLQKVTIPEIAKTDTFKKEVPVLRRTAPPNLPRVLTSRENELVKTIYVNSKEIIINIYDNGTIDHDTISVYLDKKLVISKQMLTTSPLTLKFSLDDVNSTHEVIMVAENLGDFPPNTSLMVVKAGDKEYEVRITSNEQKNAVVLFKLEGK